VILSNIQLAETLVPALVNGQSYRNQAGNPAGLIGYKNLNAKEFAKRINVPPTWVLSNSNPAVSGDLIPHLLYGTLKRYQWGGSALAAWIEQHIVGAVDALADGRSAFDYAYLNSAQFAKYLNISEPWVRDGVRTSAKEIIPHARFGKYVRFRLGSPELELWEKRHMVGGKGVEGQAHGKQNIQ